MLVKNTKISSLVLFLVGVISVFGVRIWQVRKAEKIPFVPKGSSFSFQPPSEALTGKLIEVEGELKKEPRDDEEFRGVEKGEEILDGEKLATGKDSRVVVEFSGFAEVTLGSNSEIAFINLLPSSFLIKQASGVVNYKLLQSENPLSVRSLNLLFTLEAGESKITTNEEEGGIIVEQLLGKAKIAMVDLENKTHVWEVEEGQTALINDAERRVEID